MKNDYTNDTQTYTQHIIHNTHIQHFYQAKLLFYEQYKDV